MAADEESIEQAAAERRERLKALRAAQELFDTPDDDSSHPKNTSQDGDSANNGDSNLNLKFRNYLPHDKELQEGKLAAPNLPKFEDPIATAPPPEEKEDPFLNIAPKKPNWDLRRDVQKKLDKLEKRTQKALHQLMLEHEKQRQLEDGGIAAEE
ncbi:hypothetical protein BVRB_8g191100 [Beta vulgaris subsp. vulgaris]|uniref:uncharacterized protein LOC104901690 n=1 Tax=Beta vulgaris subsp. vulgaris TaxID=3555 RepID=UPI00054017A3|nr:uncharacterized protein LOC104901690 [Beta vulgaris subsp. vulgaris]KMT03425.1 hypothetical protein BVRB_8g191100 [Beta vulgaris subsp. vulgaris]